MAKKYTHWLIDMQRFFKNSCNILYSQENMRHRCHFLSLSIIKTTKGCHNNYSKCNREYHKSCFTQMCIYKVVFIFIQSPIRMVKSVLLTIRFLLFFVTGDGVVSMATEILLTSFSPGNSHTTASLQRVVNLLLQTQYESFDKTYFPNAFSCALSQYNG